MTLLELLATIESPVINDLTTDRDDRGTAHTFNNQPTWDNVGNDFDNRPTWDNWNKKD
ncbi:multiple cyclophane-containing RiPP AmcA [Streptomyces sp. SBT349]|uniref:multiple cyclophane-containing RiPP AmcA n=1 Tax=Streptomyces sp. SBT349 TaxID=1580539 RepID=UPI000A9C564E|nr:multiple cyclophane-containing RiPP AmcA [Streptomyces sp. SBT349]